MFFWLRCIGNALFVFCDTMNGRIITNINNSNTEWELDLAEIYGPPETKSSRPLVALARCSRRSSSCASNDLALPITTTRLREPH